MILRRRLRSALPRVVVVACVVALAGFLAGTSAGAADPQGNVSGSTSTGSGKPGDTIVVTGAGWPARVTIQTSTCGQNAINGAADCNSQGAGAAVTDANGTFRVDMTIAKPPSACPCVVHIVSPDTSTKVDAPFEVVGQDFSPIVISRTVRTLTAESRLDGVGPVTAWLGGSAKRTLVLTVKNTGTNMITDPTLTVTAGKGSDPTAVLATPKIGSVPAGGTLEYRLPVTIPAMSFGKYSVKAYFGDLDEAVTTNSATTAYPWLLLVVAWLALQPLLLGLYKRRPVREGGQDDDPLWFPGPSPTPSPAATAAAATAFSLDDPMFGNRPAVVSAMSAAPLANHAQAPADYHPVFGVTDLRTYLDPVAPHPPYAVAPRIVLGGLAAPPPSTNGSTPA